MFLQLGFFPLFTANIGTKATHSLILHLVLLLSIVIHLVRLILGAIRAAVIGTDTALRALPLHLVTTLRLNAWGVLCWLSVLSIKQDFVRQIWQVFVQETIVISAETGLGQAC